MLVCSFEAQGRTKITKLRMAQRNHTYSVKQPSIKNPSASTPGTVLRRRYLGSKPEFCLKASHTLLVSAQGS